MVSFTSGNADATSYYDVYLGVWINWSRGRVLGSTITLTQRDGTLLIAFVALFVTVVGTCFWRLACFAFHSLYSTQSPRDGLHHQRQAVLRNSANATSGLCSLLQMLWAWTSGKPARAGLRLLPLLVFTLVSVAAFAIASGFSSTISTAMGREVLLSGSKCGDIGSYDNDTFYNIMNGYLAQAAAQQSIYAQQCYSNTSSSGSCETYIKGRLAATVTKNASCPFSGAICQTADQNIYLDSGLLDSYSDFGLNTPPSERFQWRSVLHCAPLNTTKYQARSNFSDDLVRDTYVDFFLGQGPKPTYKAKVPSFDQLMKENYKSSPPDYSLSTVVARYIEGTFNSSYSSFVPIPELDVPHADVALFFLAAANVVFTEPTDDAWFAAHTPVNYTRTFTSGYSLPRAFVQDAPASVLACVRQGQWCNPNLPAATRCTPLGSPVDTIYSWQAITRNEREADLMQWLRNIRDMNVADVAAATDILGAAALRARDQLRYGLQGLVPADQWQREVEGWFHMELAGLQMNFVRIATGPTDPDLPADRTHFNGTGDAFCREQKILSTAYTNISTLGLSLIFAVGGLVIALAYALEPLLSAYHRLPLPLPLHLPLHNRDRKQQQQQQQQDRSSNSSSENDSPERDPKPNPNPNPSYAYLEWTANDVLQLQRLAHEQLGLGGAWARCDQAVPVPAGPGEPLGVLDVADPRHPRLKPPPPPAARRNGERGSVAAAATAVVVEEESESGRGWDGRGGGMGEGGGCRRSRGTRARRRGARGWRRLRMCRRCRRKGRG